MSYAFFYVHCSISSRLSTKNCTKKYVKAVKAVNGYSILFQYIYTCIKTPLPGYESLSPNLLPNRKQIMVLVCNAFLVVNFDFFKQKCFCPRLSFEDIHEPHLTYMYQSPVQSGIMTPQNNDRSPFEILYNFGHMIESGVNIFRL